jgi:hypothetical protein
MAAFHGIVDVVKVLLRFGADVRQGTTEGSGARVFRNLAFYPSVPLDPTHVAVAAKAAQRALQ